jgi:hypothetical protein
MKKVFFYFVLFSLIRTFVLTMNQLVRWWIWLRRIGNCRGFGIQSPNDYWFVRYVVNEHWPYYQYAYVGMDDDWLTRKIGRLCFRVANWRQPATVVCSGELSPYAQAGCRHASVKTEGTEADMMVIAADEAIRIMESVNSSNERRVLIVKDIWRSPQLWRQIINNERTRISFDLYYCGIVFFDPKREKHNYIINF